MLLPKGYHIVLRQLEVILSVNTDLAELPLCYLWLEAEQLSAGRWGRFWPQTACIKTLLIAM